MPQNGFPFPWIPNNYINSNHYRQEGGWQFKIEDDPVEISRLTAYIHTGYLYEVTMEGLADRLMPPDSPTTETMIDSPHTIQYCLCVSTPQGHHQISVKSYRHHPTTTFEDSRLRPNLTGKFNLGASATVDFYLCATRTEGETNPFEITIGTRLDPSIFYLRVVAEINDINTFGDWL